MVRQILRKFIFWILKENYPKKKIEKKQNSIDLQYYTISDIARLLGCSMPTLSRRLLDAGIKPIKEIGTHKYFDLNVVKKHLKSNPIRKRIVNRNNKYYSVHEVSKIFSVDTSMIYKYVRQGKLKSIKSNGYIAFEKKYIDDLVLEIINKEDLWS